MDLHFSESCISLGPETQKARLSMENNARLLTQDHSQSVFSSIHHPSTSPQHPQSLSVSRNSPAFSKEHPSSNKPPAIPLQSTQQSPNPPQSPHPPDLTLHLTFQPAILPNSPSPGISLEKCKTTPPQEFDRSIVAASSSSKTAVDIHHHVPSTDTNADHLQSLNNTAITSSESIQKNNRESTQQPIPILDDANRSLASPDSTPDLDVQTDQPSCSEARLHPAQCDESSTAISDARRKRPRSQFEQPCSSSTSEENLVAKDSSRHLSGVEGASLSAPPALVGRASSQASTRSAHRQPQDRRVSAAVSVVVPRLRKAQTTTRSTKRSKSALPASLRWPDDHHHPHDMVEAEMPVQRVLAYRTEWAAFAPGTVSAVTPDKVVVQFDAQASARLDVAQLRLCHIRPGDLVQYIGTDLAEGESQLTSVRHPKRVLRVDKAPEFIDTPINSRHDVLVVCEPSLSASQESEPSHLSRFLVEAVVVLSTAGSRSHSGLKDRMLPQEILQEFRAMMVMQTGVGKRARLVDPVSNPSSSSQGLFHGFGFLLTGAPVVAAAVERRSKLPRRGTSSGSSRATIEQLVRTQGGTVIGNVSELYQLVGSDMDLLAVPPSPLDPPKPYRLVPSSTHVNLSTILLLADAPLKTLKYLLALALGIPCVSSQWVCHSCEQGRVLEWESYMIGPGPSPFLGPSGLPALMNLQVPVARRLRHDVGSLFASRTGLMMLAEKSMVFVYCSGRRLCGRSWRPWAPRDSAVWRWTPCTRWSTTDPPPYPTSISSSSTLVSRRTCFPLACDMLLPSFIETLPSSPPSQNPE
ncbi:hypothetical protein VP01_2483g3 [Puccinia sorghi]|uniref:BRCT domain-containing protein n=1 Tax=Puccinia sorghi TaxID=27349 RepID=A0A0L6V5W8_9BASI|nr:hypothetical protein VP01_2483g3 [Puccinia sorghi]